MHPSIEGLRTPPLHPIISHMHKKVPGVAFEATPGADFISLTSGFLQDQLALKHPMTAVNGDGYHRSRLILAENRI